MSKRKNTINKSSSWEEVNDLFNSKAVHVSDLVIPDAEGGLKYLFTWEKDDRKKGEHKYFKMFVIVGFHVI